MTPVGTAESIKRLAHEFAEAWGRSDVETLDQLLAKRYTHTDVNGRVWDRSSWLAFAAEPRSVGAVSSEDVEVLLLGGTAIVTGRNVVEFKDESGPAGSGEHSLRFTQVWVREANGWKRAFFQATSEDDQPAIEAPPSSAEPTPG
jgi:ketosteroid isomerase-like protein